MRVALLVVLALAAVQDDPKKPLRDALGDRALVGTWIYDDVEAGYAEAKRTGKPLMVVLRCVTCRAERTLDAQVAGRRDPDLAKVMDRYVCVRIVQGWGLDLSVFQFDWTQTWAVVLMNGERAIYGRYEPRQVDDLIGLRKAMEGALELHEKWPANKAELAGKVGPAPRWKTPEDMPALQEKGRMKPAQGRDGCIHCHTVLKGMAKSLKSAGEPVPERFTESYPMPQRVGIMLAMKERATVTYIDKNSPAEKAGIREGDRIVRFGGQPVVSWADVQWVLWIADDQAPVKVELDRAGKTVETQILLPAGWRSR